MPLESPTLLRLIGDLGAPHQTLRSNLGTSVILLSQDLNTGVCVVAGSVWDDLSPNEKMFVTHVLQEEQRINTAGGATIPPVIKVEVQ